MPEDFTRQWQASSGLNLSSSSSLFSKVRVKFYNEHYTLYQIMLIEACSVMAYMALNLLEIILRQNKTSQYTLGHYTIDRLKKRCIIITILLIKSVNENKKKE